MRFLCLSLLLVLVSCNFASNSKSSKGLVATSTGNAAGTPNKTNEPAIVEEVKEDLLAPSRPLIINMFGDASDIASETISWLDSVDDVSGIDYYEYAVSKTNKTEDIVVDWKKISGKTKGQVKDIVLEVNTDYYSLIRAVDKTGKKSDYSVSNAWIILVSPEKILNMEVSEKGIEFLKVGWGMPNDNGTTITDYNIQYREKGYTSWTTINDGESTNTSIPVDGLNPETFYEFRVRAYNGTNYSDWSNILEGQTLPQIEFFENKYKAINIGGSHTSQVVSMDNGNTITIKDVSENTEDTVVLNKGEVYSFNSEEFDVVEGQGYFYVGGKLGDNNSDGPYSANVTWSTSSWVGKEFLFNFTRNGPFTVKVYAFESSTVKIMYEGVEIESQDIVDNNGTTFSITDEGGYQITGSGLIGVFVYGQQNGDYYDPQPLLPMSKDLIGVPSKSAKITTLTDSNSTKIIHSDSTEKNINLELGKVYSENERSGPDGIGLYKGHSLRIISTDFVSANSTADSNGLCSAPFVPVSMMKKYFAINAESEYIAFASDRALTVTVIKPDGSTFDVDLTKSGDNLKAPYKAYISEDLPEGTIFEGTDSYQAWTQLKRTDYSAGEDETILFGWDDE